MDDSGRKGFLSGGVRVSEESRVISGISNRGAVISAAEREVIESGDVRTNDRHGVSGNRTAVKVSSNNRWESWGVMNMVGRVLGGKLYMDDEVEDVNDSKNWGQVNLVGDVKMRQDVIEELAFENQGEVNQVTDMNTWQDATGEPTSASGIDIKETDSNSDCVQLDLGYPAGINSLNGNRDFVSEDIVPDRRLEYEEMNDLKADVWTSERLGETKEMNDVKAEMLIPKGSLDLLSNENVPVAVLETEELSDVKASILTLKKCGEAETVGEYSEPELVWGKVRSHPWWPGQIFAPSAASDEAKKYFKKKSYLVAYFGDESFAWNEGSKLMPFRKHFSEMEKQSNTDGFSHAVSCALDEAARRVEFGLSCPCLAQEVHDEIKFQIFENAGIRDESSIRSGGDNVSNAATFLPGDTLQFLETLAKCPQSEHDRLQFTISRAQLLAYTRWKGHHRLPIYEEHIRLLEDETQCNREGNFPMEGLLPCPVSEAVNDVSSKKIELMANNGSSHKRKELSGNGKRPRFKEKSMSVLMSSESSSLQNDDKIYVRRTSKKVESSASSNSQVKRRKTLLLTSAAKSGSDATLPSNGTAKSQIVEIILADFPTPDMVLSKLILAAKSPMQGHNAMIVEVGWLREFRDSICLKTSSLAGQEVEAGKCKREEPSQTSDIISGCGGTEDSYWTDRIIQSYSQDLTLFGSQKPYEKGARLEADVDAIPKLEDNKESTNSMVLDTGNQSALTDVVSEESRPTALILKFKNLDSIPSVKDLNEIFGRFGILHESETRILSRSKCVKVIFRRPEDADTAFSSAGKYSIFGSSVISYRLRYVTLPGKSEKTTKKKKKGEQEKEGRAQKCDSV